MIRTATEPLEISQLRATLDAEHYLKAGRPAGHVLWQGAYEHDPESGTDTLVAVLCWAGAAKRLKDRDKWIDWDTVTCANRLKLTKRCKRSRLLLMPSYDAINDIVNQIDPHVLASALNQWLSQHPLTSQSPCSTAGHL